MPQLFSNAVAGPMTGILSDPEFRTVLHALEQRQGVETLAEPECVTTSGRHTQMRSTTIMNILPNFTILETSSNSTSSVPQTEPVEVGPVLDVVPYVLSDGYTIDLNVTASVIAFLGYDITTETNRPQPGFCVQKIKTAANLWDNQTLVLGNLKSDFIGGDGQIQNESKFFQDAEKKNGTVDKELLVFITATIVDPAGNRVHSDKNLPFNPTTIPPQPKISNPSR
jgi:type II secretory pathway component GspD/PulD (secretin)